MAKQIITKILDDIDGTDGAETTTFGFDGTTYEIDLSPENLQKLQDALETFIYHARRIGRASASGTARKNSSGSTPDSRQKARDIREWAAKYGVEVNDRGRVPETIVAEYEEAQGGPPKNLLQSDSASDEPEADAPKPAARKAPAKRASTKA